MGHCVNACSDCVWHGGCVLIHALRIIIMRAAIPAIIHHQCKYLGVTTIFMWEEWLCVQFRCIGATANDYKLRKHLQEIQLEPDPKCRQFVRPLIARLKLTIAASHMFLWGVPVFSEWVRDRNPGMPGATACPECKDYWLATFILEARRQDGNYYRGQKYSRCPVPLHGVKNATTFIDQGQRGHLFDAHPKMLIGTRAFVFKLTGLRSCDHHTHEEQTVDVLYSWNSALWPGTLECCFLLQW